jgi:hypothetical protein
MEEEEEAAEEEKIITALRCSWQILKEPAYVSSRARLEFRVQESGCMVDGLVQTTCVR